MSLCVKIETEIYIENFKCKSKRIEQKIKILLY